MQSFDSMQLSKLIRLGGRGGVLLTVVASMALSGCSAMHQASRLYDAAFPAQPSNVDDVVILDVMNLPALSTEQIDGSKLHCRYELHQTKEFSCRIDTDSRTIRSAKLYDEQMHLIADLDLHGKPSGANNPGTYVIDVTSATL